MKNHYRIGEVEEILGVPRSTIQYYIRCNLFRIEENGEMIYYYDLYLPIQENEK